MGMALTLRARSMHALGCLGVCSPRIFFNFRLYESVSGAFSRVKVRYLDV